MKFLKSLLAAGAASMLAFAPMASQAALTLTLDDLSTGGVDVIVLDNMAGDSFALADVITYIGSAGSFNINVSTGLGDAATPALFGLDLNSVNTSLAAGTLRLTLTETDLNFGAPAASSLLFNGLIGGTTTGNVSWSLLVDDNNVGGYGVGTVAMSGATAAPGAFANSGASYLTATDPFALTLVVDITHGASGGTTSFDFSGSIPEPTSLALISLALLGAGVASRRRKA